MDRFLLLRDFHQAISHVSLSELNGFIRTFGDTPVGPKNLDTLHCSDDLRSMGWVNARCCPMLPNFSRIV
jgi:hypothetical protein